MVKNSTCLINVKYISFLQGKRKVGMVKSAGPVKNEIKYTEFPKTYIKI